ncbi:MAG TPA: monofunctional biosynthetic peptidoglycan transglycosylase [Bacteroidales bacterium]|nr:monofunctional biosynthetic peptidoglycan transglycosylase [Bacteroidales bacterium]HPT01991.1 monofunctional biosynthetic peptidoglycan transglycosylase [Bacteroidales bacterium]
MRLIVKYLRFAILFFLISTIVVALLFRFINPPATPLMMIRVVEQLAEGESPRMQYNWIPLEKMPKNLPLAVIASEDNKFMTHHGIDLKAIQKAQKLNKRGRKLRGASTISQQTAKNVFLWPARNWVRKGLEVYFTGLIELTWGKERIMEVYLNVIEMGDGIYGAEMAAEQYFHKPAEKLTRSECAAIAAVLPGPRKWRPDRPTPYIQRKISAISSMMYKVERPGW